MKAASKWIIPPAIGATVAVVAIAVGSAFAQEPGTATPTPPAQVTPSVPVDEDDDGLQDGRGFRGGHGGAFGHNEEALAAALGITVETLDAAQQEAYAAALQQAVAQGLITQEEADALLSGEGGRGFRRHGLRGAEIDFNALLADALGITVEALDAAREEAQASALAAAVADGQITQEQADLIQARQALRDYIDQEAITAAALGITVEELEAAKADGQHLRDIIEARGLDVETVQAALQAGYEAAVQQAVTAGIITQAQADQILSGEGWGGRGPRDGFGGFGGPSFRGPRDGSDDSLPATPDSET